MTEHCVSDIGIPNGESFNIAITRMLVVKSIFIYPYEEELPGMYSGLAESEKAYI